MFSGQLTAVHCAACIGRGYHGQLAHLSLSLWASGGSSDVGNEISHCRLEDTNDGSQQNKEALLIDRLRTHGFWLLLCSVFVLTLLIVRAGQ